MKLRSFMPVLAAVLVMLTAPVFGASVFLDGFSVTTGAEVSRSVATKIDSAWDPIMATASENFRFTFVGKVSAVDTDSFWLDDGSRHPLEVVAPGYFGLVAGDWVRATGIVTHEGDEPALVADDLTWQGYPGTPRVISGRVLAEGVGVSGIYVHPDGGEGCYTDSGGHYSFQVAKGWTGSVVAQHDLYSFDPTYLYLENVTSDLANQDFQATHLYTISGRVRKTDGSPLSDVYMDAGPYRCLTGSDGYYSFHVSPHWGGGVSLQHNSYTFAPEGRDYTNVTADHTDQDYEAIAKPIISGHIRTAEGAPVSGVALWVYFDSCETDSDGYYALHVPPGWGGAVQVESQSLYTFNPESRYYTNVTTDLLDQDYEATVKPIISGHIRKADGTPVGGFYVFALGGDDTYVGQDGYYAVHVPKGWSGTVSGSSDDLYSFSPESREYTNVTADIADQDILAIDKPVISGHILTAGGVVPDYLYVYALSGESASVDFYGHYSLRVPFGWSGAVSVSQHNTYYFSPTARDYSNVTADQPNQDFQALPNPVISGYIRTAGGIPVANLEVYAQMDAGDQRTRTDCNGYYSLIVPFGWSGTVSVMPWHELYTFSLDSREYADVTSDQPNSDFEAIDKPVISGYVRTAEGTPVVGAYVEGCYTDSNGYYAIRVPTGWSGSVIISQHDFYTFTPYMHEYVDVTTDQPNQNFEAVVNPIISGHVLASDGSPLEYANLYADGLSTAYADPDGYYSIPVPTGWSGSVTVEEQDIYTFTPESRYYTDVTSDQPDQDYEAIVKPIISGYVKTADGTPVENAAIRTDDWSRWTHTDSNGYYGIAVPSAWSGTLIVSHQFYTFDPDSHAYVDVTADQPNQDFEAIPNPIISGHVRTADGAPVSYAALNVIGIGIWSADSDGYYTAYVPAGWTGTVNVQAHDLYTFSPESHGYANVTCDQVDQDFLATAKPIISGYVKTAEGTPVGRARLYTDNWSLQVYTDQTGYYSLAVPNGWSGSLHIWWHPLYAFTPESHEYANVTTDQPNQSFEATAKLIISGYVRTADGTPVRSAYIMANGSGVANTDSNGFYSFGEPAGWSGAVTVSHNLYAFAPDSRDYENLVANQENQDYEATAKPMVSGYVRSPAGL